MKKPLFRFEILEPTTIKTMDGDGTVYKPFLRIWKLFLMRRTKENFKNKDGSFNLDGLMGRPLVPFGENQELP